MASPQIENGFTRIAHELLRAMAKFEMRGSEFKITLAIITKTYGWNKKEEKISLRDFEKITLMDRKSCARAIQRLIYQKVILVKKGNAAKMIASTYSIQKDYEQWKLIPSGTDDTRLVAKVPSGKATHRPSGTDGTRPSGTDGTRPSGTPIIINNKDILKDTIKDTNTGESVILTDKQKQDAFAVLWSKYPNKDGSKEAWVEFQKTVKTTKDVIDINKAFDNYQTTREYKNGYYKSGEKWFKRWSDFITNALLDQDPAARWRS